MSTAELHSRAGRVALVTGASRGIGRAIAERLAPSAALIVTARRAESCAALVDLLRSRGTRAWALALDVAEPASIRAAALEARRIAADTGPLEWLVNNAGIAVSAPFLARGEGGDDLYTRHMDVNFHGPRRLIEELAPEMLARRSGRIVNVASSAGLQPYAYVAAYVASKHALVGYSTSVARELEKTGVTLNVVCPHFVDSPLTDASVARIVERTGRSEAQARAALAAQNPGGALVRVEHVAAVVEELLHGSRNGAIAELTGAAEPSQAVLWR